MTHWESANYLNISTRKKDGSRVDTPVWFALEHNVIYVFSEGKAGKVKRIRNFTDVRICPCNMLGKPSGNWQEASAEILETETDKQIAYNALLKKYGWQLRLLDIGASLAGKKSKRAFIRVTLHPKSV